MKDYSERRQSRAAALPKRPSVWPYVLLIQFLLLTAFLVGLGTGWYLYRQGGRYHKAPQIIKPAAKHPSAHSPNVPVSPQQPAESSPQPSQNPSQGQAATNKGSAAPPLTFYNTLQKGNKGLMGTGINQPKDSPQQTLSKPAASTPPER